MPKNILVENFWKSGSDEFNIKCKCVVHPYDIRLTEPVVNLINQKFVKDTTATNERSNMSNTIWNV